MTGTERKRVWRAKNPERSRASEHERAAARRREFWGEETYARPCASSDSYWRYEGSWGRQMQRMWYPTLGAGAHRLTKAQRRRAIKTQGAIRKAEILARFA